MACYQYVIKYGPHLLRADSDCFILRLSVGTLYFIIRSNEDVRNILVENHCTRGAIIEQFATPAAVVYEQSRVWVYFIIEDNNKRLTSSKAGI